MLYLQNRLGSDSNTRTLTIYVIAPASDRPAEFNVAPYQIGYSPFTYVLTYHVTMDSSGVFQLCKCIKVSCRIMISVVSAEIRSHHMIDKN